MLTRMNWQQTSGPPPWPQSVEYVAAPAPVYELSGWWRRAGAFMIDSVLVSVASTLVTLPLGLGMGVLSFESDDTTITAADIGYQGISMGISLVFYALIVALVMAKTNGRSVGKMAAGIRVVREDGEQISFGFALLREVVVKQFLFGILSIATLFIAELLNYLWPLWDPQNRALHDRMVKTRVVRTDRVPVPAGGHPPYPPAPYPAPPPSAGGPPPPAQQPAPAFDADRPPFPHGTVPERGQEPYRPPEGFENPVPEDGR